MQWRVKQPHGQELYYVERLDWWFPFWRYIKVFGSMEAACNFIEDGGKERFHIWRPR